MKKFLLSLVGLLGFMGMTQAETVTDVLTPTSLGLDGTSTYKVYTYTGQSGAEYYLQCSNGTDIQLRQTSPSGLVVTKSVGKVTSVEITWNAATSGGRQLNFYASETPYTNSDALYASGITSVGNVIYAAGTSVNTFTFTGGTPYFGMRSNSGALYVSQISVTWDLDGAVKTPAGLEYANDSYTAIIGESFETPTLTNPNNLPVTYSSSTPDVATVDATTGAVTPVSVGVTTITASTVGNETYAAGVATYTLTVKKAAPANTISETITAADFETLSTSYAANTFTSSVTGITYFAFAYKGNQNGQTVLQIRTTNSNEGVVVQDNPNHYKVVSVEVDQTTASQLNIYGSETAYEEAADLYSADDAGTQEGTITSTYGQIDFTGDYEAWGIRSSSGARYINYITVVYEAQDSSLEPAGLAYSAQTATVDFGATDYTLPTLSNPNNLTVTYTSSVPEVATVNTSGEVEILAYGTTVISAKSEATDTYAAGNASYTLTVYPVATSIAQIQEIAGTDDKLQVKVNCPLTVTFKNNKNVFVTDGTNAIQIYGTTPDYEEADIIPAGWVTTYTVYQTYTPELVPVTIPGESTSKNADYVAPTATEITIDMVNEVVVLDHVTFTTATPATKVNFEGTWKEATYTFRNNYEIASVPAGEYDVKCLVSVYNGNPQLYAIEFAEAGTLAVGAIEAAEGEAVYYNLQGVRVANPERGIFVKVQNGKAVKVVK